MDLLQHDHIFEYIIIVIMTYYVQFMFASLFLYSNIKYAELNSTMRVVIFKNQ